MKIQVKLFAVLYLFALNLYAHPLVENICPKTFGTKGESNSFFGFFFDSGDHLHGKLVVGESNSNDVHFESGDMTYHHSGTKSDEYLSLSSGECDAQLASMSADITLNWHGGQTLKVVYGISINLPLIDHCFYSLAGSDNQSNNLGLICNIPSSDNETLDNEIKNVTLRKIATESDRLCSIYPAQDKVACKRNLKSSIDALMYNINIDSKDFLNGTKLE